MNATPPLNDLPEHLEAMALVDHLKRCQNAQGPVFTLHCLAETMHAILSPRLITTVLAVAALLALLGLLA